MFLMHSRMLVSELGLQQDTPPARGFATYPARINNSSVKCAQTSVACAQGGCMHAQRISNHRVVVGFGKVRGNRPDQRLSECWQADSPSATSHAFGRNGSRLPQIHQSRTQSRTPVSCAKSDWIRYRDAEI